MFIIAGGRRAGKTHKLIEMLREHPGMIMVAASSQIAAMTRKEYPDLAERIVGPTANLRGLDPTRPVVVDNADLLLGFLVQHYITGITATGKAETI